MTYFWLHISDNFIRYFQDYIYWSRNFLNFGNIWWCKPYRKHWKFFPICFRFFFKYAQNFHKPSDLLSNFSRSSSSNLFLPETVQEPISPRVSSKTSLCRDFFRTYAGIFFFRRFSQDFFLTTTWDFSLEIFPAFTRSVPELRNVILLGFLMDFFRMFFFSKFLLLVWDFFSTFIRKCLVPEFCSGKIS